jgi:hypothetical protein
MCGNHIWKKLGYKDSACVQTKSQWHFLTKISPQQKSHHNREDSCSCWLHTSKIGRSKKMGIASSVTTKVVEYFDQDFNTTKLSIQL